VGGIAAAYGVERSRECRTVGVEGTVKLRACGARSRIAGELTIDSMGLRQLLT
jgi:hypothetical protein